MCGLTGFLVLDGSKTPSPRKLDRAFRCMDSRGGHAVGWIQAYKNATICEPSKFEGTASAHSDLIRTDVVGSVVFVGHTRFTTHGSASDDNNNHPHEYENENVYGAITHNGVISGHEQTARENNVQLTGECDSELIARLIESYDATIPYWKRVSKAINACTKSSCIALGCVETDGETVSFVLASRGNPVCYQVLNGVLYYASTKQALPNPNKALQLNERSVLYSTPEGFEVKQNVLDAMEFGFGFRNWQSIQPNRKKAKRKRFDWSSPEVDSFDEWIESRSV